MTREPIFWINLVKALLTILTIVGVNLTDDQNTKIAEAVALVIVLILGHLGQRALVTPVAAPAIKEGTTAKVLDADGVVVGETTVEIPETTAADEPPSDGDVTLPDESVE
jgi:hypothetical protein